jgi:SAM-dependent methyltransferase
MFRLRSDKDPERPWAKHLDRMRGPGRRRAKKGGASPSLLPLLDKLPDDALILDVGCGDSGDRREAVSNGLRAVGIDLYPPSLSWLKENFVQADAGADFPFPDATFDGVICHAMQSLLKPWDRWTLYQEIARITKPGGWLTTALYSLASGYPMKTDEEDYRMCESGFHRIRKAAVYRRCWEANCPSHPEPGSFAAIQRGVRLVDRNPEFVATAELFVAFIEEGGSIEDTIAFTGAPREQVLSMVKSLIHAGILNPTEGSLNLPWLDAYRDDRVPDGNVILVADVLAINGHVMRGLDEKGSPVYKAHKDPVELTAKGVKARKSS